MLTERGEGRPLEGRQGNHQRYSLVKEHYVGLPDFVRQDANDLDTAEVGRIPAQLVIRPVLKRHHIGSLDSGLRATLGGDR